MAKKDKRFVISHQESTLTTETTVLVDRQTGVNYLFHYRSNGGGLTPLLDRDGRPVITSVHGLED